MSSWPLMQVQMPMRSLLEKERQELLTSARIGRLGCVNDGEPYVVPINYFFEGGSVYSHSLPGHKIEILRSHPRACLQVDDIENDFTNEYYKKLLRASYFLFKCKLFLY